MQSTSAEVSKIFMTTDISLEGLVSIYEATCNVAVKIRTEEPDGNYFLIPSLIEDLMKKVDDTIVESDAAYEGRCADTILPICCRLRINCDSSCGDLRWNSLDGTSYSKRHSAY